MTVVTDDALAGGGTGGAGRAGRAGRAGGGLNAALAHGAGRGPRSARRAAGGGAERAICRRLRPAELAAVLRGGRGRPGALPGGRGRDRDDLLAAPAGRALAPAFGGASRARHLASGAREIDAARVDSVRQDVDTGEDLRGGAARLGVGARATAALCAAAGLGRRRAAGAARLRR